MTDHKGRRTRFVFDHDSDKSDGSRKRPEGEIDVKGIPQDGETFVLTDYKPGAGVYFVFLDDSVTADGTDGPKTIIGIPHVRVGILGANTPELVAGRITSAINSKSIADPLYDENNPGATQLDLYVKAEQTGAKVKLTMLSDGAARGADAFKPDHRTHFPEKGGPDPEPTYYQYVNMDLVSNVESKDFAGGMVVGTSGTNGNVEQVMGRFKDAIDASTLDFGRVEHVGRAIQLEQGDFGFDGNTRLDTSGVTGLRTQERGEEICGNFGQACCDGVTAPKCGDGSGCLAGRCVAYGGVFAKNETDGCRVPNSLMSGEPGEGDGCTCPEGLAETLITESDVDKPQF